MTRRAAIAALAAFAAFAQARDAHAEWVTEVVTQEVSAASYVTNGLIALFDGIENAGVGVHQDGAMVAWVNLIDGKNLSNSTMVAANRMMSWNSGASVTITTNPNPYYTLEFLWFYDKSALIGEYSPKMIYRGVGFCYDFNSRGIIITATDGNYGSGSYDDSSMHTITATVSSPYEGTNFTIYRDGVVGSRGSRIWTGSRGTNEILSVYGQSTAGQPCHFYVIRLYNRILTAAEISANYQYDKWRFIDGRGNFPMIFTNRVYRAPAPMRSYDAKHPINNAAARTRLGGAGSGEDGSTLRPSAHFAIKKNEED